MNIKTCIVGLGLLLFVAGCGGSGGNSNASNQAPSEITVVNDDSSNRSEDDFLTTGTNRTSKNQQQATEAKTESGNDIAQAAKTEVMENVEIAKTAAAVLLEQQGTSLPQKFIGMCDENTTWTKFNNYLHSHALDKNADPITKGKWEKTDDFKKRMKTFWPEKIQSIGVNDKFFIYTKNISKLLDEHYDVDQELLKGYDLQWNTLQCEGDSLVYQSKSQYDYDSLSDGENIMEVVYRPFIKSIPENFPDLNISVDEAKAIVQAQDLRVAVVFTLDIDSLIKNVSSWDNSELPSVKYFNAPRKSGLRLQLDVPLGRDLVVCYYRCETGRILGSWRPYYEKWVENNTSLQTP